MAAPEEDDEAWLYGGEAKLKDGDQPRLDSQLSVEASPFEPGEKSGNQRTGMEGEKDGGDGENAEDGQGDNDQDSDDDDDDDVQVTIGAIKTQTSYDATKFKSGYQRGAAPGTVPTVAKQPAKGLDLEAQGSVNGVPVYEFDLDSLQAEEKPWRKPGADITDYFNYGFNEDTWTKYCERQRRLRLENNASIGGAPKPFAPRSTPNRQQNNEKVSTPQGDAAAQAEALSAQRRAGPPPGRKYAGTIDVIGSTSRDSRRPQRDFEEEMQAAEALDYKKFSDIPPTSQASQPPASSVVATPTHVPPPNYSMPPPTASLPPPGVPPPGMPPQQMVPPPTGVPPPVSMGGPPPSFAPNMMPDPYVDYYNQPPSGLPPDRGLPPPGYGYDGPGSYGAPQYGGPPHGGPLHGGPPHGGPPHGGPPHGGPPPGPGGPGWDKRPPDGYNMQPGLAPGWEYGRSPPRSGSNHASSDDARDGRSSSREYRGSGGRYGSRWVNKRHPLFSVN